MPGDIGYATEKFTSAVSTLATAEGSLRERLLMAYRDQGARAHPLKGGSEELRDRIDALHERLTSTPAVADEGTIEATIDAMTPRDLDETAQELVGIAFALTRERG